MESILPGFQLRASDLNDRIMGFRSAICGTGHTVSTNDTDVADCSITITAPLDNMSCTVMGVFDVDSNGTNDVFYGNLDVDGDIQMEQAVWKGAGRATIGQTWYVQLAGSGSHTLKMFTYKDGSSNTVSVFVTNTRLSLIMSGIGNA